LRGIGGRSNTKGDKEQKRRKNCKIGAVVALGSSGGSLVVTPDCDTAVQDSNPAISPAYSGLPVLRWAAIWDGTLLLAIL
jgi:hypothetical protein